MECYGLSLRIPAYNGISHYFIALCGHRQFYVMLRTLVIIFDFIPGGLLSAIELVFNHVHPSFDGLRINPLIKTGSVLPSVPSK